MSQLNRYWLFALIVITAESSASNLLSLSGQEQARLLGWQKTLSSSICPGAYIPADVAPKEPAAGLLFDADEADIFEKEGKAQLSGHVSIRQGPYEVTSGAAELQRDVQSKQLYYLAVKDYVRLWFPGFTLISDFADYNLQTQAANLNGVLYHFKQPWQGGTIDSAGTAKAIKKRGQGKVTLKQASYSTCPVNDPPWHIKASRLFVNQETGWASVTHARFYVGRVPIFYFPYYRFPISDQRESGVLMPSFSYASGSKVNVTLPLYLNLAPNMDATYYPNYRQAQGWLHGLEWRTLSQYGMSHLRFDVIAHDRLFSQFKQDAPTKFSKVAHRNRYLEKIQAANPTRSSILWDGDYHLGRFWSLTWKLEHVSDPYVYRDLSDDEPKKTSDQLESKFDLNYHQNHWSSGVLWQSFQTLHRIDEDPIDEQYNALPQMHLAYTKLGSKWEVTWLGEWTHFHKSVDPFSREASVTADRSYGEFHWAKPLHVGYYKMKPSVLLRGVDYQGVNGQGKNLHKGVPSLMLDQSLLFERNWKKNKWTQTLMPRLLGLWTPYRDQDHLPQFDSKWQTFSYDSLFSPYRFKGHDRVSDEARIAYGFESELKRQDDQQAIASLQVGSGLAFRNRLVCLEQPCDDDTSHDQFSPVVADINVQLGGEKSLQASWAWLPDRNHVDNGSLTWHYSHGPHQLIDLSYYYKRVSDIDTKGKHTVDLGVISSLGPRLQALGGMSYNFFEHHPEKSYVGFNYESCCWASRLMFTRELKTDHEHLGTDYDYGAKLQIMLKGLGTVGSSAGTLLKKFNPQYQDPYGAGLLGT